MTACVISKKNVQVNDLDFKIGAINMCKVTHDVHV